MPFSANPYDHTGTVDTTGYGTGADVTVQDATAAIGDTFWGSEVVPPALNLGPIRSVAGVVDAFTDETLQTHSDARVQYDSYRQNHGAYWTLGTNGHYVFSLT